MALFSWDSSFETGNSMIDQQHLRLVDLINELADALAGQVGDTVPDRIHRQLLDYTRYHFSSEEKLMRASGIDEESFQRHRQKHQEFIRSIDLENATVQRHPEDLLSYLMDWLISHILDTDREMVESLGILDPETGLKAGNQRARRQAVGKQTEQLLSALRESETRFRILADSAPVMLWLSRENGARTFFNQAWLSMTGQDQNQARQTGWQAVICPEDRPGYLRDYHHDHLHQQGGRREFRLMKADGSVIWVLEDTRPRFLNNGTFVGLTGNCVDITAQKESQQLLEQMNSELEKRVETAIRELQESNSRLREEAETRLVYQQQLEREKFEQQQLIDRLNRTTSQLVQSEKMSAVGQLAAGVAHEINNPVGYVRSNITTLSGYMKDFVSLLRCYESMEDLLAADPQRQAQLDRLKQQLDPEYLKQDTTELLRETGEGLERVRRIVQDLKDFSRADDAEWQFADLHKGLDSTLNVASNEIKYQADVVKDYGELPLVQCLPNQLNQVFMNLLVNAAQSMAEKGEIRIRTRLENGMAEIGISDTGTGIPDAVRERIFEPFFTTKPVGRGTGLGLSVSYGIVQNHRGTLSVESTSGEGSTFIIRLPLKQEPYES